MKGGEIAIVSSRWRDNNSGGIEGEAQYLKTYLEKMEIYDIPATYRARNFERVVKQEIKEQVREIYRTYGGNWEDFGRAIKAPILRMLPK